MNKFVKLVSAHFNDHTTPVTSSPRDGLSYWREKILLYLIYILIIFSIIAYIPSIILSVSEKLWMIVIADTAAYVFLFYLFFSKSMTVRSRTIAILTLTYILGILLLVSVGPYGAGYLWMFVVPILAAVLMDLKTAIYSIILNFVTLVILGFLIQYNLVLPFIRMQFSFDAWLVIISNLTFLEIILTLSIVIIIQGLEKSLFNEKEISHSLEIKTEELAKAKDEAEKADSMKSEFLAQMSHEIRTPINTILNSVSLIQKQFNELSNNDRKEIFAMIQTGSNRVIRTIDLILNMSEIQTGSYKKNLEKICLLNDIIKPLLTEFNYAAANKKLSLILTPHKKNDYILSGDRYAVTQIFANLIDNGIKFTKEGSVTIAINENKYSIIADIIDTGIGIAPDYLKDIFKPFSQEESGYTRHFDGNGLGLALVKRYCEINDAQIFVESNKGKGSRFTVMFSKSSL